MESTLRNLIICQSTHHGNTLKIAEAIAAVLKAEIKKPAELDPSNIANYDLIGFGSGIYNGYHHPSFFRLLENLPEIDKQKAFIFSTSTIFVDRMHLKLRNILTEKGFEIIGEFNCKGLMTSSFTRFIFGGLNKGRPNEKDLNKAREFADTIK